MDTEKYIDTPDSVQNPQSPSVDFSLHSCPARDTAQPAARKWAFRKVTSISLGVGVAAGAIVAASTGFMWEPETTELAASFTAMGIFGASVGMLRSWLKGVFSHHANESIKIAYPIEKQLEKQPPSSIITVVYPEMGDFPASDTHSRDKLAAAKLALLSLDPAKTICQ